MVDVVGSTKPTAQEKLIESKLVLRALYSRVTQTYTRLWIVWSGGMNGLIKQTKPYSSLDEAEEWSVSAQWDNLVGRSKTAWQANSQAEIVEAAPLDEGEEAEQQFLELEAIVEEEVEIMEESDGDQDDGNNGYVVEEGGDDIGE